MHSYTLYPKLFESTKLVGVFFACDFYENCEYWQQRIIQMRTIVWECGNMENNNGAPAFAHTNCGKESKYTFFECKYISQVLLAFLSFQHCAVCANSASGFFVRVYFLSV